MSEAAHDKIREGLIEALKTAHTELAWFQFYAGIVGDENWIPHVSDAEDLEADLINSKLIYGEGRYSKEAVMAAIPPIVDIRVGRILATVGAAQ